tara:strand:+ start:198 stop:752 length:555 start_codon:yes stop_codon:yes gene_type:complete
VNKSFLKFVADFGPLLIFFVIYYKSGNNLSTAIPPLIIATIIAVAVIYFVEKKIPYIPLFGGIIITVFGGLSLYFNNPVFLYMKPTIINIIFGLTLLFSQFFFKKNLIEFFFKTAFQLSQTGWDKLNNRYAIFLIFLAILNEIIWRIYAPEKEYIWVNFKVWGILPLTFVFTALQLPLINKYKI